MTGRHSDDPQVAAVLAKFPGAEVADVRHPQTEDEAPLDLGRGKGKSLSMLAGLALGEALRIRSAQEALVASGDRQAADANATARADCFDAIARILETAAANPVIVEQLRKGAAPAAPARSGQSIGYVTVAKIHNPIGGGS